MNQALPRAAASAADATAPVNAGSSGASNPAEEPVRDDELVQRIRAGDHDAFRELFDRYHRRAYAVALGVVKNPHDALDVVQEAFIKVHRHIANFQGSSSIYTWLYRIVMNLSIDHVRKAKKTMEFDEQGAKDATAEGSDLLPRVVESNPGKTVVRKEMTAHIQAALNQLPDYHRQVIVLRELEGCSYEEMAKILKVPKGTIMSRLFHARRKMQDALKHYLDGDFQIAE
jgi:RNA polymerase sigma-70 factor (ECF subfamily)